MPADPISLLEVRGSHRQVGQQIGEAMKPRLPHLTQQVREGLPAGVTWQDMLYQGQLYLAHSRAVYPQYVEELEGIAEASGMPFAEIFLSVCEELWEPAAWPRGTSDGRRSPAEPPFVSDRGCTDLLARGRATADGSTLVAHTNDLSPSVEEDLVLLKVRAGDEPEFLGVSIAGVGFSAGFNAAGVSMTGNQVSCNDIRPGVPRLLSVRAILGARRLEEAMNACLVPRRASNYNNVIADANGEVYSMEGSATDCEPIYIEGDILAHANHYVSPPMRPFEATRDESSNSVIRHHRAWRLLRENFGRLTPELFQVLLADHANFPGSICKHGIQSVTVFSLIVRPEERRAWIGRGRPCQTTYYEYALEPWVPPADWSG
jgi:isopenicillin-N N-acyltransferase-like protein